MLKEIKLLRGLLSMILCFSVVFAMFSVNAFASENDLVYGGEIRQTLQSILLEHNPNATIQIASYENTVVNRDEFEIEIKKLKSKLSSIIVLPKNIYLDSKDTIVIEKPLNYDNIISPNALFITEDYSTSKNIADDYGNATIVLNFSATRNEDTREWVSVSNINTYQRGPFKNFVSWTPTSSDYYIGADRHYLEVWAYGLMTTSDEFLGDTYGTTSEHAIGYARTLF